MVVVLLVMILQQFLKHLEDILVQFDVIKNIFTVGNYIVKSQISVRCTSTSAFSVVDSLDLEDGAIISIDKDVYGLGETVHLTGIMPPTGDNSIIILSY